MSKKLFLIVLISLTFCLFGCEEIKKQIQKAVTDVAKDVIETKVNEQLADYGVEGFELPEAQSYSGNVKTEDGITTYTVIINEPATSKEDYIASLETSLGANFEGLEVESGMEYTTTVNGVEYTVEFVENTNSWEIVVHSEANEAPVEE